MLPCAFVYTPGKAQRRGVSPWSCKGSPWCLEGLAWSHPLILGIVPKVFTEIKLSESFSSKDVFTSALGFNSHKYLHLYMEIHIPV
jgi:hypothetical protein